MSDLPPADHDHDHDRDGHLHLDDLRDAALAAERATGEHEATVVEARDHLLKRLVMIGAGFAVLIAGIVMLPLPGPGWLVIAIGLTMLSPHFTWADRMVRYVRRRVPGIPEDGRIPRTTLAVMVTVTVVTVAFSLWWTFLR